MLKLCAGMGLVHVLLQLKPRGRACHMWRNAVKLPGSVHLIACRFHERNRARSVFKILGF